MTLRNLAPGRWELRVYAGLDPVTRKKRWISKTVRGTETQAKKAERALRTEVDQGRHMTSQGSVGHLLEQWYDQRSHKWGHRHAASVRNLIDKRLLPTIGATRLDRLTTKDIDDLYHSWRVEGLSPATVAKYHAIVHGALKQGVKWKWLGFNVAEDADRGELKTKPITPPSAAELRQVIAALAAENDLALPAFVRLAAASGCRRGELCALRTLDFDLGAGTVTVARSLSQVGGDIRVKEPKTRAGRRVISLDDATLALVVAHMERALAAAQLAGSALITNPYVFSRAVDGSEPWQPDSITKRWSRLRKRHGLDGVRLHDLRHSTATELLGAGVDVRTVAGRLGHAQPAVTLNVYAAFLPARDVEAGRVIGARLDALPPATREDQA